MTKRKVDFNNRCEFGHVVDFSFRYYYCYLTYTISESFYKLHMLKPKYTIKCAPTLFISFLNFNSEPLMCCCGSTYARF